MEWLNKLKEKAYYALIHSMERSQAQITLLGILGFVGFPTYYFIWKYLFPQPYENLWIRLLGSLLCLLLLLRNHWPKSARAYLPIYWYLTLLYVIPFFFNFMLLKNNISVVWVMSTMAGLFILILIVDWIWLAILYISGAILAWIAYALTTEHGLHILFHYFQYTMIYIFLGVVGALFIYNTARLQREKLEGMASISSNVAHELRTPLLGIKSGVVGIKRYLPTLFSAYEKAQEAGLEVPKIRTAHLNTLAPALEGMEAETNYANTIIDMLLMNVGRQPIELASFEELSISDCVDEALKRYPFRSTGEADKVHWNKDSNFYFYGSHLLIVHVMFNLLKNALHFIVKAEKGEIFIWFERGKNYNRLHFKDTGQGIPPEVLPRLFTRFFTTTLTGTGIGLFFCRTVMESLGGTIQCLSEENVYSEFILSFPAIDGSMPSSRRSSK